MGLEAGTVTIDAGGNPNASSAGTMARSIYDALEATFDLTGFAALSSAAKQTALQRLADLSNAVGSGVVAHFHERVMTPEGGMTDTIVNQTGAPSVKGTIVSLTSGGFHVLTNQYDSIGVVYESGVAHGQPCRVVTAGFAETLFADGVAPVAGYWAFCAAAPNLGRASNLAAPPGGGIPELDAHFTELGHTKESKSAGTGVLAFIFLHPN
jgi:hypothetical protein